MKEHNEEKSPSHQEGGLNKLNQDLMLSTLSFLPLKDQVSLFSTSKTQSEEMREHMSISKLLYLVARGKQDEAEAMIRDNPELLIKSGDVTDGAGRYFENITALQYAGWALDAHMWTMMLPYFNQIDAQEEAGNQLRALEEKGTAHGHRFDFRPLLNAYQSVIVTAGWESWSRPQRQQHWCRVIGGEQWLLPDHVVQEYTTPDRALSPLPDYSNASRPSDHPRYGVEWWRDEVESNDGSGEIRKLGDTWAALRDILHNRAADAADVTSRDGDGAPFWIVWADAMPHYAMADCDAIRSLSTHRTQQLEELLSSFSITPQAREQKSPGP